MTLFFQFLLFLLDICGRAYCVKRSLKHWIIINWFSLACDWTQKHLFNYVVGLFLSVSLTKWNGGSFLFPIQFFSFVLCVKTKNYDKYFDFHSSNPFRLIKHRSGIWFFFLFGKMMPNDDYNEGTSGIKWNHSHRINNNNNNSSNRRRGNSTIYLHQKSKNRTTMHWNSYFLAQYQFEKKT